jgi:broad specificity phosphatase PhoE
MAARILLIRHASVDLLGKAIAGRGRGVHLNERGRLEAEQLAQRLSETTLEAIYCSPMERTQETAEALARSKDLDVLTRDEFTEIDFGDWTGKSFAELDQIPAWHRFNQCRSLGRIPGGESMLEVVQRMVRGVEAVCQQHRSGTVGILSHCDPIRAALVHYTGMNLDGILRLTIAPASISAVDVEPCGPRVLALNNVSGRFRIGEG